MMTDAMTEETKKSGKGPRQHRDPNKKGPAKADPESLSRAAYWYLERFATSAENLRRVLMRRVEKAARAPGAQDSDRGDGAAAIDDIIKRLVRDGLLDDAAYAEARVRSMRAAGKPAKAIKWALAGKGVAAEVAEQAVATIDAETAREGEDANFRAAVKFAKRRRLGPYRDPEKRDACRQKDLAALARAGFGYGLAERIIKADSAAEPAEEDS